MQIPGNGELPGRLETERLLLLRPTREDIGPLSQLWRDEQTQRFLGGVRTPEHAKETAAGVLQSWELYGVGMWVVWTRSRCERIGLCGLGLFEGEPELAYKYFPQFWGHGYATEAARTCVACAFDVLQLERLVGVTQEANLASQHVLEKIGMHHVRDLWKWDAPQRYYELSRARFLS